VIVSVANAAGSTNGCVDNPVVAATATTPVTLTLNVNHNILSGQFCFVAGIEGLFGANGWWQATVTAPNALTLNGSVGTGSYTVGGTLEGGDLGLVDVVINDNVTPDGQTEDTLWAPTTGITVAGVVYLPSANIPAYKASLASLLNSYFLTIPLGGVTNVEASNIIPIGAVEGIMYAAGVLAPNTPSIVSSVTGVTLNGSPNDFSLAPTAMAILVSGITQITLVGT
jgi:hypothetical protein